MSSGLISELLGYTSIGCWLFAQFPQVLENIRRQSCEGLALPFLFNWLLGDITNLIGCVLTHQLPFQTVLATYFVMVDLMLFSQYFYYSPSTMKAVVSGSLAPSPVQRYSTHGRRVSTEHENRYRELSNAAANVAIAAALAASEEELHRGAYSKDNATFQGHRRSSTSITRSEAEEVDDEVDEAALAALADSFHSEGGRKRISWSREGYASAGRGGGSTSRTRTNVSPLTPLHTSLNLGTGDAATGPGSARGRPLQRQIVDSPIDVQDSERRDDAFGGSVSRSVVKGRRNSRASQRSVGLVFLGVWALFGIGTLSRTSLSVSSSSNGVVLSEVPHSIPLYQVTDTSSLPTIPTEEPSADRLVLEQRASRELPEEPSSERVVGRIFAWACTTLYLTSRLPQIWKNFVRKSVEGLSMYLFVFAFLGNTFYVMSILSSPNLSRPQPAATAFLLESMPYLLGSGGTLLFDVTIVSQSFLYRRPPGHAHTHSHHHSHHQHQHQHQHRHSQHQRSSYSRSRTESYNQIIHKTSPLYGSISTVPEEERRLLYSPVRDLERGVGYEGIERSSQQQQQAGQARRRKDVSDAGDSEGTVS